MKIKEGDIVTDEELQKEQWIFVRDANNCNVYRKNDRCMFVSKSKKRVILIFETGERYATS